jgi:hypothetical protein
VAYVPDKLIGRSVVDIVYCHSNLYSTQRRGEVAGVSGTLLDDELSHLVAVARKLVN